MMAGATVAQAQAQETVKVLVCRAPHIQNMLIGKAFVSPAGARFVAYTRFDQGGTPTGPMIELGLAAPLPLKAGQQCAQGSAHVTGNPGGAPVMMPKREFHEAGLIPGAAEPVSDDGPTTAPTYSDRPPSAAEERIAARAAAKARADKTALRLAAGGNADLIATIIP